MAETGIAHQFDDEAQRHEAASAGMWLFLASEVLFFGGLFLGYTIYRLTFPEAFRVGSHHLYMWIAAANTAVLLTSSLFVALAHHAASEGELKATLRLLAATIGLGVLFLLLKGLEYYLDVRESMLPVIKFDAGKIHGAKPAQVELFLIFYWIMTGIHALHVTIGVGVWITLLVLVRRQGETAPLKNTIEMAGLYWHFVDIVWLFLLPLLYLVGV